MSLPWNTQRQRIVAATLQEFAGGLIRAFPATRQIRADCLELCDGPVCLRFDLAKAPSRRIGALDLPCIQVSISVLNGEAAEVARLIERIDRATQRGGG